MEIVLDIASSAEFWRQRYPLNRMPCAPSPISTIVPALGKHEIESLAPSWMLSTEFLAPSGGKLHLLTFDAKQRRNLNSISIHAWSSKVPEGAFYKLSDNAIVESPEFMFLHAAAILEFTQLIAFGYELCGLYSFNQREERGFRKREMPLTSLPQIESFLHKAVSCYGCNTAKRALPYVLERSASPMETFDAMTMCLPYRYGGYGLPKPIMNHRVDLSSKAARIAKRGKCYLDMGYPEHHLDIEHHGKLDHSSEVDIASDRARVNGLKEMGFEVVELTSDQVGDLFAFQYIIERISRKLGKRLLKQKLGATPERLALRNELFAWNRSSGRLR